MKKLLYILPIVLLMGFIHINKKEISFKFDKKEGLFVNDQKIDTLKGYSQLYQLIGEESIDTNRIFWDNYGIHCEKGAGITDLQVVVLMMETIKALDDIDVKVYIAGKRLNFGIKEKNIKKEFKVAEAEISHSYQMEAGSGEIVGFYFDREGELELVAFEFRK